MKHELSPEEVRHIERYRDLIEEFQAALDSQMQVEECTAFAKRNNLFVLETYADKAISGKTDRRKAFQRMMKDAEKGFSRL